MRISRLHLSPFGGFPDRELRFAPGLNVVLGANDVGKSTVFRAIDSALFLRSKLNRGTKEGKDALPRVIPIGGDHARLALDFSEAGRAYRLEKTWGQGGSSSLTPEGGARLAVEESVEEALRAVLPAPAATFQNVLFMGQGALEGTVAQLGRERAALHSLGDLLRVTIDQTSGVSVEALRALVAERIKGAFGHWDRRTNLPEQGRGIENKWTREAGSILKAYYAREELRRDLRVAQELEEARDRHLAALAAKQSALAAARDFVRDNEPFVRSASERAALEAKLAQARQGCESLKKDLDAWLRAEAEARQFRPDVERLGPRKAALEAELQGAVQRAKNRERLARLERARAATASLAEAREKISAVPALQPGDLKRLRSAVREVDALKAQAKGGKLQLQLHVRHDLEVTFRKDFEAERKGTMPAGKSMTLNAGARIQIASELFEIQVTGGEAGIGELEGDLTRAQEALAKLFAELKVKSAEDAEERHEKLVQLQADLRAREQDLARALPAGEKLEDLERAAAADAAPGRELEAINAELLVLRGELDGRQKGLNAAEGALQALRERSGAESSEALSARLLDRKAVAAELERQRAALPELPASVGRLEEFLPRFRAAQAALVSLHDEIGSLKEQAAEVKTKLGDQSAQELERAFREASAASERELARGKALLRVEEAMRALDAGGGDLYGGFRTELESQVSVLSRGKYGRASMSEALPSLFERKDGVAVPYDWLSAGTKDAFALALRLAMASHFLGASDGFLLVDDPLVNMDPERQRTAAGMLREFASRRQMLVFTCHPAHAELLGGNRIDL